MLHNPVTREYVRVVEHTEHQAVGEMLAVPGGAVAGAHHRNAARIFLATEHGGALYAKRYGPNTSQEVAHDR